MKNLGKSTSVSSQNRLFKLLTTEFHDARQAYLLFEEFLRRRTYSKDFCVRLISLARKSVGTPWEIRRLAVLMLEHQILKLRPDNLTEFDFLFSELHLKASSALSQGIVRKVLKEGYSNAETAAFITQFRRKLERLNRVHRQIKGSVTPDSALHDFIAASRSHSKLSLARYLFKPDEIVAEILRQLQVTDGVTDPDTAHPPFVGSEVARAIGRLPDFEAAILRGLCESSNVYWVSDTTSSELNSLVEYPLTTVVLVIKPPGSDIEFEIKRAGRRGPNVLNVVFARNGYRVAPSHRLDGGNMQWLLQYEAISASKLSIIYRLVHGTEAPIASYVSRSTVYSVPGKDFAVQTLPYFTEPQLFGKGFREMRAAMEESVEAFIEEGNELLPSLQGDLGLTAQFIGHVIPAQAILCGTSSFRLDKLALYLSSHGPERYFSAGLRIKPRKRDERRLADELLEEVLGVYHAPTARYQTYEQYLDAAFSITENRNRANQIYLSLIEEIARLWGTLLAVRGYSRGESFVARNVGLKSVWDEGQWKVKIIFMDHDAVVLPGPEDKDFHAKNILPAMSLDESYIWGSAPEQFATSEVGYLQRIYRIGSELDAQGQVLARTALKQAYRKTQQSLLTNAKLRSFFNEEFVALIPDWDSLVGGYLQMNGDKSTNAVWRKKLRKLPAARKYRPTLLEAYLDVIEKNRAFLERCSYLYGVDDGSANSNNED